MGSAVLKRTLLSEATFLQAVSLERKRAERSRRLFVLMLVDPGASSLNGNRHSVLSQTVSAIISASRETDVAGWYKDGSLLGVIFAELGKTDKKSILAPFPTKGT